jgi:hypothetical protein
MKKTLHKTLCCLLALTAALGLSAQTKVVTVYTTGTEGDLANLYAGGTFWGISPNGEYATGNAEGYAGTSFLWNRTTGEFTQITSEHGEECYAYDVSNDGVVVGCFAHDNNGEVKEGTEPYIVPGYWKDGVWTALEIPFEIQRTDMNGYARAISGDGRTITGYVYDTYDQHDFNYATGKWNETTRKVRKLRPAVWIDGKLQPYENLPFGETVGQGMVANYMSDDAKILGGFAEHDSGSRSPAIWVNGEMTRIYGKQDIDINKDLYFYAGYVYSISHEGKYAAGQWCPQGDDGYTKTYGFVYDIEKGTTEEIDGWAACTSIVDDGTVFGYTGYLGQALIHKGNFNGLLSDYIAQITGAAAPKDLPSTIICNSQDGNVFCGYYVHNSSMGPLMVPSLVVIGEIPDGINNVEGRRDITIKGDMVYAPGAKELAVYDASGRLISSGKGDEISLGGAKGVVVVKASFGKSGNVASQFIVK